MANHVLSLEAPDTLNECILRVIDTSVYAASVPIVCPTLNVTVPGFNHSVQMEVQANFILNLTACDLQLQTTDCGTSFLNLPDGIYVLRYSLSPNDVVFVEYNHLRITAALKKYEKILCNLQVGACEPDPETRHKLHHLRDIKDMLDAAKAKAEFCHDPKQAMLIYQYALFQLSKITCRHC